MRHARYRLFVCALICAACASCAIGWADYQSSPPPDFTVPRATRPVKVEYDPSGPRPRVAVVHVIGEIHEEQAAEYEVQIKSLVDADYIVVDIDSPGGVLSAAREMMVATIGAHAKTVCVAHAAASGAFALFQSCTLRLVLPRSELMLHRARLAFPAATLIESIQDTFDLGAINDRWLHLACARLSITYEQCSDAVAGDREMWLDPTQAIEAGAADEMAPDLGTVVQALRAVGTSAP